MKFIEARPFADPEVAARKLIELANAFGPHRDRFFRFTRRLWCARCMLETFRRDARCGRIDSVANG